MLSSENRSYCSTWCSCWENWANRWRLLDSDSLKNRWPLVSPFWCCHLHAVHCGARYHLAQLDDAAPFQTVSRGWCWQPGVAGFIWTLLPDVWGMGVADVAQVLAPDVCGSISVTTDSVPLVTRYPCSSAIASSTISSHRTTSSMSWPSLVNCSSHW